MKKIEKLEQIVEVEFLQEIERNRNKINEIIGVLNNRLFEPTIAVPNQSQKRPKKQERMIPLKDEDIDVEKLKELASDNYPEEPEKQEEWREIDKDIRYEIGGKRYVSINGEEYVRTKDISKLLSERQQKGWMEGFDEGTSVEKELSNLLKDKNEDI